MPAVAITVPGVGESITEGILSRWLKPDGSAVKAGEPLFELETDKANNVVPASASGVLKINVAEGATVEIGATVGTIDPAGQAAAAPAPSKPAATKDAPAASTNASATASAAASSSVASGSNGGGGVALSPAVRRIVTEEHVDPSQVEGMGRGGRITKGDVVAHLSTPPAEPAA